MSITARPMWIRGCCGRARNSVCALCIPHQVGPKAEAKIERFFRTVREQFLVEITGDPDVIGRHHVTDLAELNRLFAAWVETVYHRTVHSETGQTPLARWSAGGPVALARPGGARRGVPVGGAPPRDQDRDACRCTATATRSTRRWWAAKWSWCSTRSI